MQAYRFLRQILTGKKGTGKHHPQRILAAVPWSTASRCCGSPAERQHASPDIAESRIKMIVVVLDYPGVGSAKRTKRLGLERSELAVRYLLDEVRPKTVMPGSYVQALLERLGDTTVEAVVAYCASASLARCLAPNRTICLINPEFPDRRFAVEKLSSLLPGSEVEPLSQDRLPYLEAKLADSHLRKLVQHEMPSSTVKAARDLASSQIEWVAHLAAASGPSGAVQHELHITSADHLCAGSCSSDHVVFDSDARTMFRSPALTEKIMSEVAADE
jgi:hypothetical protein